MGSRILSVPSNVGIVQTGHDFLGLSSAWSQGGFGPNRRSEGRPRGKGLREYPRRHVPLVSGLWERMRNLRHSRPSPSVRSFPLHVLQVVLFRLLLLQLLVFPAYGQQPVAETAVFHSIASIRSLSFDQANLGHPALIRGVITLSVQRGLVVHDATEGIWVYWTRFEDYVPGDAVEVQGSIGPGMFAPVVNATSVRKVGIAPLPKPLPVTFKQLSRGDFDAQYVTITGPIRSVGKREVPGGSKHLGCEDR